MPEIEVVKMDPEERALWLEYNPYKKRVLVNTDKMVKHLVTLWGSGRVGINNRETGEYIAGTTK